MVRTITLSSTTSSNSPQHRYDLQPLGPEVWTTQNYDSSNVFKGYAQGVKTFKNGKTAHRYVLLHRWNTFTSATAKAV